MSTSVPDYNIDAIPAGDETWEREDAGTGHHIWSRDADQDEFENDVPEHLLVVEVELQWLNDVWNAVLLKPNTQRELLDVVTPRCERSESFEDAVEHVERLLEEER